MIPRYHIILGAVFSLVIWLVFPEIQGLFILLIFLSSFLIDFDHYVLAVMKTKSISLIDAFEYYKKLKKDAKKEKGKKKSFFFLFHTIEFHILVLLLGFAWVGFFYIFIGMVFHSILDFTYLAYKKQIYKRWFFLTEWLIRKI